MKNEAREIFKTTINELKEKGFKKEFGSLFDYVEHSEKYQLLNDLKYRLDEKNSFEIIIMVDVCNNYKWDIVGKMLYIEKDGEITKKEYINKRLNSKSFFEYAPAMDDLLIPITEELRKAFL